MTMTTPRLLIVDDEPSVLSALRRSLRQHFGQTLAVDTCDDPVAALALARAQPYDIVLSDLRMPEVDGLAFLALVSAVAPHSVRMVLTGSADFETAQRAINEAGVFRYLTKPWTENELHSHLGAAITQCTAQRAALPAVTDPREAERLRLEQLEPGITAVEWGPAGEVLMPPLDGSA
jgi:two-component system probable response regulator PhcQ